MAGLDPVPPPNHGWDLAPLSRMSVVDLRCAAKQAARLGWARVRKTLTGRGKSWGGVKSLHLTSMSNLAPLALLGLFCCAAGKTVSCMLSNVKPGQGVVVFCVCSVCLTSYINGLTITYSVTSWVSNGTQKVEPNQFLKSR